MKYNRNLQQSLYAEPLYFSVIDNISCFNITINTITITNLTFSRVLKIFIFFFNTSSLLECFFITSLQYLLSLIIILIKLWTASSPRYDLKGLLNLSSTNTILWPYNQHVFDICSDKAHLDFPSQYLLALKYFQN